MRRLLALIAALCTAVGLAILLPATAGAAPACVGAWNSGQVYTGGMTASYNGHNWYAKWWTQNERPGSSDVWRDEGACGTGGGGTPDPSGFVVTEAQFNQMFPNRNPFYTYAGLVAATKKYPAFAGTGSDTVKKQEAAAFLANVSHETGGLYYIVEQNTANYPHYCDANQPYGCPAGQAAYYGRGPIQLSWNFNYKAAGDALGIDLLNNPWRVEREPDVAMMTGLWYWNTQNGPGTMTAHNAMVNGAGFGQTIWAINGSLECNGRNPAQVQSRVTKYQQFTQILGVPAGSNLSC
ncbi:MULTISPECIES: glycoside hydrolase family 19 protein [Streptomyces]|uniref:Chitinase n=1 Tax=Streptomyces hydrogenans TaxID=1873719 RepID=A0ABQ3PFR0_9ACTN|nr:glycoside hydrolase family 19 protein [Streptomyces hydrogenans]GHG45630.1 chitinase [Streptomyces hydrogenans]GHI23852.1 chitinase [Streptomyces hydrogenans]